MHKQFIHLSRLVLEADTVLSVGSGDADGIVDDLVIRNHLGLPLIPGTTLAGCLIDAMSWRDSVNIKGGPEGPPDHQTFWASNFITSDAVLLGHGLKVASSIYDTEDQQNIFKEYRTLPIRDHVRMTHLGASDSDGMGKFDDEVVYKGSRFICELELQWDEKNPDIWLKLLKHLEASFLLLGSGTRKGYGRLKCIAIYTKEFDLESDLAFYLEHDPALELPIGWDQVNPAQHILPGFSTIHNTIKNVEGFHFGSGQEDADQGTDDGVKMEKVIIWTSETANVEYRYLIAGSSIKGVIAHRFAARHLTVEEILEKELKEVPEDIASLESEDEIRKWVEKLKSVTDDPGTLFKTRHKDVLKSIFGFEKDDTSGDIGKLIIDDIYIHPDQVSIGNLTHNSIDRFSGGTIESALFSETFLTLKDTISLTIHTHEPFPGNQLSDISDIVGEISSGMLPLGGKTTKGYGAFKS